MARRKIGRTLASLVGAGIVSAFNPRDVEYSPDVSPLTSSQLTNSQPVEKPSEKSPFTTYSHPQVALTIFNEYSTELKVRGLYSIACDLVSFFSDHIELDVALSRLLENDSTSYENARKRDILMGEGFSAKAYHAKLFS